jgi:hypothetical protein
MESTRATISLSRRSAMPSYLVEPPDSTMLAYGSVAHVVLHHSGEQENMVSWMPVASLPMKDDWKSNWGHGSARCPRR